MTSTPLIPFFNELQGKVKGFLGFKLAEPPNGGLYGWAALIAVWLTLFSALGIESTFGLMMPALLADSSLQAQRAQLAWVQSIATFLELFLGLGVGWLTHRFGARIVTFSGGALLALGLFLSSTAKSVAALYFTYSVMVGVGMALSYGAASIAVGQYFTTKRAFANALSATGVGAGTMILCKIVGEIIKASSWRSCMQILSVISAGTICTGALMLVPVEQQHTGDTPLPTPGATPTAGKTPVPDGKPYPAGVAASGGVAEAARALGTPQRQGQAGPPPSIRVPSGGALTSSSASRSAENDGVSLLSSRTSANAAHMEEISVHVMTPLQEGGAGAGEGGAGEEDKGDADTDGSRSRSDSNVVSLDLNGPPAALSAGIDSGLASQSPAMAPHPGSMNIGPRHSVSMKTADLTPLALPEPVQRRESQDRIDSGGIAGSAARHRSRIAVLSPGGGGEIGGVAGGTTGGQGADGASLPGSARTAGLRARPRMGSTGTGTGAGTPRSSNDDAQLLFLRSLHHGAGSFVHLPIELLRIRARRGSTGGGVAGAVAGGTPVAGTGTGTGRARACSVHSPSVSTTGGLVSAGTPVLAGIETGAAVGRQASGRSAHGKAGGGLQQQGAAAGAAAGNVQDWLSGSSGSTNAMTTGSTSAATGSSSAAVSAATGSYASGMLSPINESPRPGGVGAAGAPGDGTGSSPQEGKGTPEWDKQGRVCTCDEHEEHDNAPPAPETPAHAVLHSTQFWAIAVAMALIVSASTMQGIHLGAAAAQDAGLGSDFSSNMYMTIGLAGIIGRTGTAIFTLLYDVDMLFLLQLYAAATGLALSGLALYGKNAGYLMFNACVYGGLGGSTFALVPPVLASTFGIEGLPFALGGTFTVRAPMVLIAGPIAGWVRDATGRYDDVWLVAGFGTVLAALPIGLMRCACTRRKL